MKKKLYRSEPKCFRINNKEVHDIVNLLPHGKLSEIINECLEEYFRNNDISVVKLGGMHDRSK